MKSGIEEKEKLALPSINSQPLSNLRPIPLSKNVNKHQPNSNANIGHSRNNTDQNLPQSNSTKNAKDDIKDSKDIYVYNPSLNSNLHSSVNINSPNRNRGENILQNPENTMTSLEKHPYFHFLSPNRLTQNNSQSEIGKEHQSQSILDNSNIFFSPKVGKKWLQNKYFLFEGIKKPISSKFGLHSERLQTEISKIRHLKSSKNLKTMASIGRNEDIERLFTTNRSHYSSSLFLTRKNYQNGRQSTKNAKLKNLKKSQFRVKSYSSHKRATKKVVEEQIRRFKLERMQS